MTTGPEAETCVSLSGALAWLDYCLSETLAAMAAVKAAALDGLGRGEVSPEQLMAMCEVAAGLITLRGRARRQFKPAVSAGQMQVVELDLETP